MLLQMVSGRVWRKVAASGLMPLHPAANPAAAVNTARNGK
jgi:hypothetical protein